MDYLKHAFERHAIRQEAVASYMGITQALVSMLLSGKQQPSLKQELDMVTFLCNAISLKFETEEVIRNGVSNTN